MSLSKFAIVPTALLSLVAFAQSASAQATRTWVAGVGDDANPCSRTAPCKTFAGAISKTAAGGHIDCIDQGAYGAVTIAKSITLDCDGVTAGVLHSSTNGIVVNAAATDVVVLRGLQIDGSPPTSPGLNGVRFIAGGALFVENCSIRDSNGGAPNGHGVLFAPSVGSPKLQITNSRIIGNGAATSGAGVQIAPTGAGGAEVVIRNTELTGNTIGVRADAGNTTGEIRINISSTSATHSRFHGVSALGGTGRVRMILDGVVVSNNAGEGVRVVGPNVGVRIGRSTVSYNGTGITATGGGNILSYGDNFIDGNTVDGVTPPLSPQK